MDVASSTPGSLLAAWLRQMRGFRPRLTLGEEVSRRTRTRWQRRHRRCAVGWDRVNLAAQ